MAFQMNDLPNDPPGRDAVHAAHTAHLYNEAGEKHTRVLVLLAARSACLMCVPLPAVCGSARSARASGIWDLGSGIVLCVFRGGSR